jgi:SpoVK/Ycf46/Vps4 family AAA+-type ATPase
MPPSPPDAALAHYPAWAQDLARTYLTKTINQFALHGNVRDLVPTEDEEGRPDYATLRQFLANDLFAGRDIVVFYDRSAGLQFASREAQADFARALSGYDSLFGTEYAQKLPKDPVRVFQLLDNYVRLRLGEGKRMAVVIDYAETIVPMSEAASYSAEDRAALVSLQKWAHDPQLLKHDFTLVLVTENLRDLNAQIVQSPYTAELEIAMPREKERRAFVDFFLQGTAGERFAEHSDVKPAQLAEQTAGLGYVQLRTVLADPIENGRRLTWDELTLKKKALIEAEAYGLLEFVETDYTLDFVAGHTEAKAHLREAASALKAGRPDVMPMGYLVAGPVGTGKTFLITTFAGEIGVPMVKLKNFRSQWQGVTEGNLEKILTLLRAMTPVAVMIDEADAALGDRDASGDSGVSSRVFSQIAQAMSDTRYRGRIIWFLVTARPDLMPVDLKRQGRAEEHLALFYPTTREDRLELFEVMAKKTGVPLSPDEVPEALLDGERTYSGADMEALLTRAKFRAVADSQAPADAPVETDPAGDGAPPQPDASPARPGTVTTEILREVVEDFIPPSYPLQVELQNLAAVLECTSRAMLPPRFRQMPREQAVRRVEELKQLLGER